MTRTARFLVLFSAVFALIAFGAACGGGGDDEPTATATEAATSTSTSAPTETATSTEPPTATPTPFDGDVASMRIPRFNVSAAIENRGLTPDNVLETPEDPHKVAWYGIYPKPGWGENSVYSAHVDFWPDIKGPFYQLDELEEGDTVEVVMEDGTTYVYEVFRTERYEVDTIPMGDLIWPANRPADEEWVTLITCGGEFVEYEGGGGAGYYLHRDVAVAKRIS